MNQNLGMGASNNIGILKSNTQFVYILNPDTKLNELTFDKLIEVNLPILGLIIKFNSSLMKVYINI